MTWELVVPGLCYSSTTGCQTIPLPMHHRLLELRHLVVRVSRYPAATGPEKFFGRSRKLCLAVKNQKFFALTGHVRSSIYGGDGTRLNYIYPPGTSIALDSDKSPTWTRWRTELELFDRQAATVMNVMRFRNNK